MTTTNKRYECTIEVRGYELDSFGHVNHAVYVSYLEHARWKLLAEEGITLAKFNEWRCWPVIAALEIRYLRPTYLGETLTVQSTNALKGKTSFVVTHEILRAGEAVVKATVTVVMVDKSGRPVRIPESVETLWGITA